MKLRILIGLMLATCLTSQLQAMITRRSATNTPRPEIKLPIPAQAAQAQADILAKKLKKFFYGKIKSQTAKKLIMQTLQAYRTSAVLTEKKETVANGITAMRALDMLHSLMKKSKPFNTFLKTALNLDQFVTALVATLTQLTKNPDKDSLFEHAFSVITTTCNNIIKEYILYARQQIDNAAYQGGRTPQAQQRTVALEQQKKQLEDEYFACIIQGTVDQSYWEAFSEEFAEECRLSSHNTFLSDRVKDYDQQAQTLAHTTVVVQQEKAALESRLASHTLDTSEALSALGTAYYLDSKQNELCASANILLEQVNETAREQAECTSALTDIQQKYAARAQALKVAKTTKALLEQKRENLSTQLSLTTQKYTDSLNVSPRDMSLQKRAHCTVLMQEYFARLHEGIKIFLQSNQQQLYLPIASLGLIETLVTELIATKSCYTEDQPILQRGLEIAKANKQISPYFYELLQRYIMASVTPDGNASGFSWELAVAAWLYTELQKTPQKQQLEGLNVHIYNPLDCTGKSQEFDACCPTVLFECKNVNWDKHDLPAPKLQQLRSQKAIADSLGKKYLVISKQQVPAQLHSLLTAEQIDYISPNEKTWSNLARTTGKLRTGLPINVGSLYNTTAQALTQQAGYYKPSCAITPADK